MVGRQGWRAGEGQGRLPWGRPEPAARSLREGAVGSPPHCRPEGAELVGSTGRNPKPPASAGPAGLSHLSIGRPVRTHQENLGGAREGGDQQAPRTLPWTPAWLMLVPPGGP